MCVNNIFYQTQAQTVAVNLRVNDFFRAVKRFEYFREFRFLDSQTVIFDRDFYFTVSVVDGNFYKLFAV